MLKAHIEYLANRFRSRPLIAAVSSVLFFRGGAAALAFLSNALVARWLGPDAFAPFAILFAVMMVVSGFAGPPLDMSLVRFAARYIADGRDDSRPYFRFVFHVKCWAGALTLLAGLLLARPLTHMWIESSASVQGAISPPPPAGMFLAFAGGVIITFWSFAQAYYQAHQQFVKYGRFELTSSLMRLIVVAILLAAGTHSVMILFGGYVAALFTVMAAGWLSLPRGLLRVDIPPGVGRSFFHFAKWVMLAGFFTTLVQRLDILLLGHFGVAREHIGNYGAAVSLALLGDLFVLTVLHVMLPRASQIKTAAEMVRFLKRFWLPSLLASAAMASGVFFAEPLARLAFGSAFVLTGRLFAILFAGAVTSLAAAPAVAAVFALGAPRVVAVLEGVRLVASLAIGLWAAPRYGVVGMAWTMSAVRGTIALLTYVAAHYELRRIRAAESITM